LLRSATAVLILGVLLLLGAGIGCIAVSNRVSSPQAIVNEFSLRLDGQIKLLDQEALRFLEEEKRNADFLPGQDVQSSFFVYDHGQVISWSDNNYIPTYASVSDTFRLKLLRSGSSDYLAKKWTIRPGRFLVAVIPLYRKYTITNNYLNTVWNRAIFPSGNVSILEANANIGLPVCVEGQCPFKVSFLQQQLLLHERLQQAAAVLISLSLVLLIVVVYRLVGRLRYAEVQFAILYGFFYALRVGMTRLNFPGAFIDSDLFNPQFFASSDLNASLGDLMLNELGIFALTYFLFRNLFHFRIVRYSLQRPVLTWGLSVLSALGVLFAALFPFVVIQTIYNNSSIILDISQSLQFDVLRITALLAVLLACTCSFLFFHAFGRLLVGDGNLLRIVACMAIAVGIFTGINTLTKQPFISSLLIGVGYFALVYALKLYSSLRRLGFATFAYMFLSVFFLSANAAYSMQYFGREKKLESQFKFANNFLVERDYFGEYLLRELGMKIAEDKFIQSRIASPFLRKDVIRQKIRQVFLPSYFNKYDVDIHIFNASGAEVDGRMAGTFSDLIGIYNQDAYRTDYDGVYFVSRPSTDVTQKYLVVVPMSRLSAMAGWVVVELSLKKIIPENVYPELLVDNSFQQFYRSQELSYAVFYRNTLLYSSGAFNYEHSFDRMLLGSGALHTHGLHYAGFDHIAVEDENERIAVVSSPETTTTYALANFSFLLVLGLATVLVFILALGIINYVQGYKLYFSARIQLFLNVAFFLPLIIVSGVTLQLTTRSSQNQMNEEYINKSKQFGDQISVVLHDYMSVRGDDYVTTFANKLTDLAKFTSLEANVYQASGVLLATSQPLIFENELISNYINASAIRKIRRGENLFIETEAVGTLEYHVAYAALKNPTNGELIGILGIPFFQSEYSLEKIQINILANIMNIFALILIVLVVLSYFVSQWLTFPLKFITQSLRRTSLTRMNQPLVWRSDDEIGLMVKEYNQMLYKLGESKAELEQTQRERAWREIAQQVAHEIKNPLTPMKLTLQQLERSIQNNANTPEKTSKAIGSLLAQVDTLNDIASSFSAFAKMPEPVMRPFELIQLLRRTVDLHRSTGEVSLETALREVYIQGDEQLLGRTFSNIILNALQSGRPGEALRVVVSAERTGNRVLLSFADTGKGIEPEVAERIFVPHFTTKKSGSGLGLAIAKQAIEQMGGKIWFETEVGKGTVFFIEINAN